MSAIELKPIGQTDGTAEATVSFAKPEKKYFPLTRLLTTGNTQGEITLKGQTHLETAKKVAGFAVGVLLDLIGSIISLVYALKTYFDNREIKAFNALAPLEQAEKNLTAQLDKCRDAALAYKKNPTDLKKNLQLRDAIRETSQILQLNQFVFPGQAAQFEEFVRSRISADFKGVEISITPHQKDDAHSFNYPLTELLLNGFYPIDEKGVANAYIQGVDPKSITFRFEDGIFAPSKQGIINIFHAQSSINLNDALRNLTTNLGNIRRPEQKDADKIRDEIRREIRSKLEDKNSAEFRLAAEGAARFLVGNNDASYAAALGNALTNTDLDKLSKNLVQQNILPSTRQNAFKSAVQRFGEVSELRTKLINGAKALAYLGVAGFASTHLPIIGPFVTAAVGGPLVGAVGALSQGAALAASYLPGSATLVSGAATAAHKLGGIIGGPALAQTFARGAVKGSLLAANAVSAVGGGISAAGGYIGSATNHAKGLAQSTVAGLAGKLPVGAPEALRTAAATAAPYAIPAGAAALTGYGLYKAYEYATTPGLTKGQQTQKALRQTQDLRNNARAVLINSQKEAAKSMPVEKAKQKVDALAVAIQETDEAYRVAEQNAKEANDHPGDMDKLNTAHKAAVFAKEKAAATQKAAAQFEHEVEQAHKEYVDLSEFFKKAYKLLGVVDTDLKKFDHSIHKNDKRDELLAKLAKAEKLLQEFEKTKLANVKEELQQVAQLEHQIAAILKAKQADPSKNWDEQLAQLGVAKDERAANSAELLRQYKEVKAEIERLKAALQKINNPKKGWFR